MKHLAESDRKRKNKYTILGVLFLVLLIGLFIVSPKKPPESKFVVNNGIVVDIETDREWIAGPDTDTTWDEAKSWVNKVSVDGGGWRMPTMFELKSLFQRGMGTRHMTPYLKTTGWFLWINILVVLFLLFIIWEGHYDVKKNLASRHYGQAAVSMVIYLTALIYTGKLASFVASVIFNWE